MWALVTKNGAAKPLSHRFAALWEPIWGLCGFIGQFLEESFSETGFPAQEFLSYSESMRA